MIFNLLDAHCRLIGSFSTVENYKSFETQKTELNKSVVFVEGYVSTYSINEEEYINMKGFP